MRRLRANWSPELRCGHFLLVTMAMVVLAAAAPSFGQVATGEISGTLTDEQGHPLAGVAVTLAGPAMVGAMTVRTDQQGRYHFRAVPAGQKYTLKCPPPGCHALVERPLFITAGARLTVSLHLVAPGSVAPELGSIVGRALDTGGRGLTGVKVTLSGGALKSARVVHTLARGEYGFPEAPANPDYRLDFEKAGYETTTSSPVAVTSGGETVVDACMELESAPLRLEEWQSFPAPGKNPVGLARGRRDELKGDDLWVVDAGDPTEEQGGPGLWRVNAKSGRRELFDLEGCKAPGPAAYDGQHDVLWIVDYPEARVLARRQGRASRTVEPQIYRVNLEGFRARRPLKCEKPIPVTRSADTGPITGLAWDGSRLWMSMSGGLCACVYQLNPADGTVVMSFFPRCEPLAIAIDPPEVCLPAAAGTAAERKPLLLSIAADRGEGRSALLQRRRLRAAKRTFGRPAPVPRTEYYSEFQAKQGLEKAVLRIKSIATSRGDVWVLDMSTTDKKLLQFVPRPAER